MTHIQTKNNCDMEEINAVVLALRNKTKMEPKIGIVCGSGLSNLTDLLEDPIEIPYTEIPGFPKAHVAGHGNAIVFGHFNGVEVVCMKGRFHFYSGYSMQHVVLGVRAMAKVGVKRLVVTNAAGALNIDYNVGDIVVLADHINLPGICGQNPLIGYNDNTLGPRFPPMSDVYEPEMQQIVIQVAGRLGHSGWVRRGGIYAAVLGPSYETPAEARFLRMIGGDCVGMSTVPEVIAARHAGMRVLGLSLITNKVVADPKKEGPASHAEVLEAVERRKCWLPSLVRNCVLQIAKEILGMGDGATFESPTSSDCEASRQNKKAKIDAVTNGSSNGTSASAPEEGGDAKRVRKSTDDDAK